ncbi:MAG TPA: hypothetical protein VGM86_05750 [Thermoanaerobaculia bacterium]
MDRRLSVPPTNFASQYASPELLVAAGPMIEATWSVPPVLAKRLIRADRPVPASILGELLLDMGASSTCISRTAADELGLTPIRFGRTYGAGGLHELPIYRAQLSISITDPAGTSTFNFDVEANAIERLEESIASLRLQNAGRPVRLIGLLGRDVFRNTVIIYDGIRGRFEVDFDLDSLQSESQLGKAPRS